MEKSSRTGHLSTFQQLIVLLSQPVAVESVYPFQWGKCRKTFGNRHRGTCTRGLEIDISKCDSTKPVCWVWIQTQSMSSSKPLIFQKICLDPNPVIQLGPIAMPIFQGFQKCFVKVAILYWHDSRCLEKAIIVPNHTLPKS